MINNRKIREKMKVIVRDLTIKSKRAIKYPGVVIDDRLNFNVSVDRRLRLGSESENFAIRLKTEHFNEEDNSENDNVCMLT